MSAVVVVEISFTVLCAWLILMPRRFVNSMNAWSRVLGGRGRCHPPLSLVRIAGLVMLLLFWFVVRAVNSEG